MNSSGHVTIGNNIYFGTNVVVLKGVTIGDNCVIGACSLVTKNIPANSVAAGVPCRVICSIDEYYRKRKQVALAEAVEYVQSIQKRFKRDPFKRELYEEFIYFTHKDNSTIAFVTISLKTATLITPQCNLCIYHKKCTKKHRKKTIFIVSYSQVNPSASIELLASS